MEPIVVKEEPKEVVMAKEDVKEEKKGDISMCPVAPILWLFGLHKAKPPAGHMNMNKEEVMEYLNSEKQKVR